MSIRKIQRRIKNRFIKKTARGVKNIYFIILDFFGKVLFCSGRALRIIPPVRPYSKDKIKRILVIRADRIGDVVLSTPTVRALRENFPESFIGFLTTSYTMELIIENRDIDELIVYERRATIFQKCEFIKKLKRYKFDLAVILSPYFESALFGYLSGAAFRIGYPLSGSGFLLTTKVDIKNRYKHEIETCLDVVRAIGIDASDKRPKLTISQEAENYAEDFFNKCRISTLNLKICIHPGGYSEHTRWLPEGYAEVADKLINQYQAKVILVGGIGDRVTIDIVVKLMSQRPIVADLNNSLQRSAAIIKKCDIFLGNVSGPMHIATAVGTPVVAIFGAIHPLEHENKWAPYGEGHIIIRKKMDCVDCHPGHCRDYKCMRMITVDDVLKALEAQINKIKKLK
jgi:lipopolysaccharide heptosyltransferase II